MTLLAHEDNKSVHYRPDLTRQQSLPNPSKGGFGPFIQPCKLPPYKVRDATRPVVRHEYCEFTTKSEDVGGL